MEKSNPLDGLNSAQREAVLYFDGPLLIVAGAGSGKTRVITHKIAYMIHEGIFHPREILAVTFTNKAAREMKERVEKLVGVDVGYMQISTFHSFCLKILRREIEHIGRSRDFEIVDVDFQKKIVKELLKEQKISSSKISPDYILKGISRAKLKYKTVKEYLDSLPIHLSEGEEYVSLIYPLYEERLLKLNGLDFDDLLNKTNELFERFPKIRRRYSERFRYILVDEFQDTNPPQYELIKHLTTTHKNICVVGDEDQSIYSFRGAIIENILNFERDFPKTKVIKLEQNYRSTENILGVAQNVIKNNIQRRDKTLWSKLGKGEKVKLIVGNDSDREVKYVIDEIEKLSKKYPDETIGILYRMNFISRRYEEKLRLKGLKFKVYGAMSFFKRKEVKDMVAYLKLCVNPYSDFSLLRIINTPPRKIGEKTVEKLRNAAFKMNVSMFELLEKSIEENLKLININQHLEKFYRMMKGFIELYRQNKLSPYEFGKTVFLESGYRDYLERYFFDSSEEKIGNVEELLQMLAGELEEGKEMEEFLDEISLLSSGDEVEKDAKIFLMTIHTAKGLEFDNVFLVSMEDGVLPHSRSLDFDGGNLEEERRLCYVAMTRAKRRLYLSYAKRKYNYDTESFIYAKRSRFLDEISDGLIEEVGDVFNREYLNENVEGVDAIRKFFYGERDEKKSVSEESQLKDVVKFHGQEKRNPHLISSGDRVMHPKFGRGIVWNVKDTPSGKKITVLFEMYGKKILMEKFAKLKKV